MSGGSLHDLMDLMLEDSEQAMAEAEARVDDARKRAREERAAAVRRSAEAEAPKKIEFAFDSIEALTGLADPEIQKVLQKVSPDDILVLLASSSELLQTRLLSNLSKDSVKWLRENLPFMGDLRDSERSANHLKVLKVVDALVQEGEIGAPEEESIGADDAPQAEDKEIRDLLTEIVKVAKLSGPESLQEVLTATGQPMLAQGLALVLSGAKDDVLKEGLTQCREAIEAAFRQRLMWMEEAMVAIAEGEEAETFRKRLFDDA